MIEQLKRQVKTVIRKVNSENQYRQRQKALSHYKEDPDFENITLTKESLEKVAEFRDKGVISFPGAFQEEATYLDTQFFNNPNLGLHGDDPWYRNVLDDAQRKTGRTVSLQISFANSGLRNLFFSDELIGIVCHYYRMQPYYRNLPTLAQQEFGEENSRSIQGKYHLDGGMKQVSSMLLVNDIGLEDTHMQYAIGTNNLEVPKNIDRFSWTDDEIDSKYEVMDLVGKKGTLFIFDAGNGYHRASYKAGSVRKILHLNMTFGHSLKHEYEPSSADFGFLEGEKDYVKRSITKLLPST